MNMYKSNLLLGVLCLFHAFLNTMDAASITELSSYPTFCQQAATQNGVFKNFRNHPIYQQALEHVDYTTGKKYLDHVLQNSPEFIKLFDQFRKNDAIGNPKVYNYQEYGWFAPTTLRYIKVASDIKRKFGDTKHMHVVEIGGGYGGQCKILADVLGFASYTIIDLPPCIALTQKYLSEQQVDNVYFFDRNQVADAGQYDLVISNYAFSEIDNTEQSLYIKYVIKNTPRGYMTMNFIAPHLNSMSLEQMTQILHDQGYQTTIDPEYPNTHPKNRILSWTTR
jgi:putative sugar O-methyltransferase